MKSLLKNKKLITLKLEDFPALKLLSKNKNFVQKLDKGNSIAIIDKSDLEILKKMQNILSDSSKLAQVFVPKNKQLNFIVNVKKTYADLLKDLRNSEVNSDSL